MDKAQFLKTHGRKSKVVTVGGDEIAISELTLGQRSKLMPEIKKSPINAQVLVVCMGCDLFDENNPDDAEAVAGLDPDFLLELSDEILNLSGLGDESAEKNS